MNAVEIEVATKTGKPRGICAGCGRLVMLARDGMVHGHKATRVRAEYEFDGSVKGVEYRADEQCSGAHELPEATR